MEIYMPIAELPLNVFYVLLLGAAAGFLAGMFGIGGGFLMSPFLIFMGVSPAVAVASSTNQIIASSVSGFMAHKRRKSVDFKMALYMVAGGVLGSYIGSIIFSALKRIGQLDLIISLCYVLFLGTIGILMGLESWRTIRHKKSGAAPRPIKERNWQDDLPWKVDFPQSEMTISGYLPIAIGFVSGIIVSIMGIGGGFLTIPAMIYILRMPTAMVVGTSLFQMIIITANTTFFHAYYSHTVDIFLAILLLLGSVIGVQFGTKAAYKLPAENLRGLLALLVLGVAIRMAIGLFLPPSNPYSVVPV
jgi:uncharacterized membrane protein YfcA